VDWRKVADADTVKIVMCMQVIHELDEKKDDPRLSSRAQRVIKEIRAIRSSGNSIRDAVTLHVYIKEPRSTDFSDTLSPDSGDDRIIHLVQKYVEETGDSAVSVYSEDNGMLLKCEAHRVPYLEPEEGTRLETPQTEQDKKYKAAITELNNLKNRLPVLRLSAVIRGQADASEVLELVESESQIFDPDFQITALRQKYPHLQESEYEDEYVPRALISLQEFSSEDVQEYSRELEIFFADFRRYVEQVNHVVDASDRLLIISLSLANVGNASADDVDIRIRFPAIFELIGIANSNEVKAFMSPTAPTPPELPQTPLQRATDPKMPSLEIAEYAHDETVTIAHEADATHTFHAHLPRLKHLNSIEVSSLYCVIENWEDVRPFEVDFSISTASHPERIEGKLVFKIRRKAK
jgi:hypothetical protein